MNCGVAYDVRKMAFDITNLAVYISGEGEVGLVEGGGENKICYSLLRHTPILAHTLRTLTTEVVQSINNANSNLSIPESSYIAQINMFSSACKFMMKLFESMSVKIGESGMVSQLSKLLPSSDSVPKALGLSLSSLCSLSVGGAGGREWSEVGGGGRAAFDECCKR